MIAFAAYRRTGQQPEYTSTWGRVIGKSPDLKTLDLVLEMFSAKKRQLNTVVECVRAWRFLLQDTRYELVHDRRVEVMKWTKAADEDGSSTGGNGLR